MLPLTGVRHIHVGGNRLELDVSQPFSRLIYFGLYEEAFIAFLRKNVKPGDVVVDGGANVGYVSAVASSLVGDHGKVFAIEPSVTCLGRLKSHLTAANVTIVHAALGEVVRKAVFYDTPRVLSKGFACLGEIEIPEDGTAYDVAVTTIDDLRERRGISRIRMLKLDIEEAELLAIKGAEQALRAAAIDYLLVETDFAYARAAAIHEALVGHGYTPHLLTRNGNLRALDFRRPGRMRTDVLWASRSHASR
jgi:FkbM family methyltransferase